MSEIERMNTDTLTDSPQGTEVCMSEEKKININLLASALKGLRDSAKGDYKEILKHLHYNGPNFKTPKQFDAFLLEVVYEHFDTIDTDYILISLGLLLGFEREIKIGKRYEKYLQYSNHIQDIYSGYCKEPYDSVDEEQKKRYKAALRDLADRRIDRLAEILAEIRMQKDFEENVKTALANYYDETNNTVKLEKPYYIIIQQEDDPSFIENNPDTSPVSIAEIEESENVTEQKMNDRHEGESIEPGPSEPPTPIPDNPPDILPKPPKIAVWLKIAIFVFVGSVAALAITETRNSSIAKKAISLALEDLKADQKPCSIKFRNPDAWLPFGESCYLTIEPTPNNATLDGLRCKSEGDNAHMIEVLSEPGLHIRTVEESKDSEECNVDVRAYMDYDNNIHDVVTIHIMKSGESKPMGNGEVPDEVSDTPSQKVDESY